MTKQSEDKNNEEKGLTKIKFNLQSEVQYRTTNADGEEEEYIIETDRNWTQWFDPTQEVISVDTTPVQLQDIPNEENHESKKKKEKSVVKEQKKNPTRMEATCSSASSSFHKQRPLNRVVHLDNAESKNTQTAVNLSTHMIQNLEKVNRNFEGGVKDIEDEYGDDECGGVIVYKKRGIFGKRKEKDNVIAKKREEEDDEDNIKYVDYDSETKADFKELHLDSSDEEESDCDSSSKSSMNKKRKVMKRVSNSPNDTKKSKPNSKGKK